MSTIPAGLTCAACSQKLYPSIATATESGWQHTGKCPKVCAVDGCNRKHRARGYCDTHYKREVVRATAQRRSEPLHLEDIEWLAETGEVWERAIQRLNTREDTLRKFLERHGRYDLIRTLRRRVVAA